jgi:hypothetical protein
MQFLLFHVLQLNGAAAFDACFGIADFLIQRVVLFEQPIEVPVALAQSGNQVAVLSEHRASLAALEIRGAPVLRLPALAGAGFDAWTVPDYACS